MFIWYKCWGVYVLSSAKYPRNGICVPTPIYLLRFTRALFLVGSRFLSLFWSVWLLFCALLWSFFVFSAVIFIHRLDTPLTDDVDFTVTPAFLTDRECDAAKAVVDI